MNRATQVDVDRDGTVISCIVGYPPESKYSLKRAETHGGGGMVVRLLYLV